MNMQDEMRNLAREARDASRVMANLSTGVKNELLRNMAEALETGAEELMRPTKATSPRPASAASPRR